MHTGSADTAASRRLDALGNVDGASPMRSMPASASRLSRSKISWFPKCSREFARHEMPRAPIPNFTSAFCGDALIRLVSPGITVRR